MAPYIVGHNVLNAHAAAAELFHSSYQPLHAGSTISMTLNCDFSIAASASPQDIAAGEAGAEAEAEA